MRAPNTRAQVAMCLPASSTLASPKAFGPMGADWWGRHALGEKAFSSDVRGTLGYQPPSTCLSSLGSSHRLDYLCLQADPASR